jgi:hypothetical protein
MTNARFFSVTHTTIIGGVRCTPTVCYRLPVEYAQTITDMAAKGLARVFNEEQRFVSGVPYPVKKPSLPPKPSSASGTVVAAGVSSGKKGKAPRRTVKREFD